jgi:hypothetical protein
MTKTRRTIKPRCFLLYALAPEEMPAAEANRVLNELVADNHYPLAVFHDHFIGHPGGLVIFFVETQEQRDQLLDGDPLPGWNVEIQPLIFSHSPAAFDEQIDFTLRAYRNLDWEQLKKEQRPRYGDPRREAESANEDVSE